MIINAYWQTSNESLKNKFCGFLGLAEKVALLYLDDAENTFCHLLFYIPLEEGVRNGVIAEF